MIVSQVKKSIPTRSAVELGRSLHLVHHLHQGKIAKGMYLASKVCRRGRMISLAREGRKEPRCVEGARVGEG